MKIIEIEWDDAFYNEGPLYTKNLTREPMRCHNVGYFIEENNLQVVLAIEWGVKEQTWRHIVAIPKVCIVKRRWIRR